MSLLLPDVSEFQSGGTTPNWTGIKAQNGGAAIIRVGYGNAKLDGMLVHNRSTIKGLSYTFCGLYQYLRAGQDAISQANAFIGWIGPHLNPGEIPILDLEEGGGNQSTRANQWFGVIDAHYGLTSLPLNQRSWLYSGNSFAVSAGLAPIFNSARHTWVAAYRSSETGLLPHTLWQSTDGQTGANRTNWSGCGFVDTSIFHGTLAELGAMGWHPKVDPPPAHTVPPVPQPLGEQLLRADDKTYAVSFGNSQYSFISFFTDNGGSFPPASIKIITVDITHEKTSVALPAHCAGVSIQRQGNAADWCPVAFNLG